MEQLYLIGKNIAHSASPAMYRALFAAEGMGWTYELADLPTEEAAQHFLDGTSWFALNATTPYKALALQAADVHAASVQLAQGANLLFRKEESIVALNTDGVGCINYIQHAGYSFADARVVVCGTGPTALAIFAAAAQAGAARIALLGRNPNRAKDVLEGFMARYKKLAYATIDLKPAHNAQRSFREAFEQPTYVFGSYTTSTQEIAVADIIIDATPLGMNEADPAPFNTDLLANQRLVFDVVYGHGQTALVCAAQEKGVPVLDGQGMVVAQAVENAFTLFDVAGTTPHASRSEAFECMARAAGFSLAQRTEQEA